MDLSSFAANRRARELPILQIKIHVSWPDGYAPVGVADIEAGRHREFDSQSEQACRWEEPRAGICTVGQARMIGAAVEGRAVGWEEEAEVNS